MTGPLREKVIEFVKAFFTRKGRIPTIQTIVTECGTNRTALYQCFPGGLGGICRGAGVSNPRARVTRVLKSQGENREDSGLREIVADGNQPSVLTKPNHEEKNADISTELSKT
ncbi:TusE/DsrC/DsvC family sulfur relay protein [Candidatus Bathyarchaeota archaeon]|nr:TusE/DsrC/DsvC family sulfur relay protein [Candidatus Bathyarchaeota archaeon]